MNRRQLLLIGLVVLAASYVLAGGFGGLTADPADRETLDREQLIQPAEGGSYLWPYTSRGRSSDGRTLAINLLIHGSDERVHQALVDRTELEWEETDPDERDAETDTYEITADEDAIEWDDADGSTRYTYFDTTPRGGGGYWVEESYQLHTGTYLGSRHHIRAYTPPSDDWTAIQAHREYWDWFRLRHTVTDIQNSRNLLEGEFLDQPYVEEVRREYHGTDGGRSDGWLSVIELATVGSLPSPVPVAFAGVVGVLGIVDGGTGRAVWRAARRLIGWVYANVRGFILATALAGLFLGVRSAGLVLEAALPWITPKAFVVVLYPALVVGLPAVTLVFTQPLERATRFLRVQRVTSWVGHPLKPQPAFAFTVVGLSAAFIVDFVGLGVVALPIELLLHRVGLTVALGLLAAGAARSDTEGSGLVAVGLLGWITGLVMPLVGYV